MQQQYERCCPPLRTACTMRISMVARACVHIGAHVHGKSIGGSSINGVPGAQKTMFAHAAPWLAITIIAVWKSRAWALTLMDASSSTKCSRLRAECPSSAASARSSSPSARGIVRSRRLVVRLVRSMMRMPGVVTALHALAGSAGSNAPPRVLAACARVAVPMVPPLIMAWRKRAK